MAAVAPCIARLQGRRRWTAADIWSNCLASGETPSCRARWRHEFLSQLRHQRVQYYASTQEIRGAIERDMTVFGTITSGMTTGVCEVGDSLLHHVIGYFQSLLTQSFVPFMVAPIAKCLLEEINARSVLVARAMCIRVVNTPGDLNIRCAGALFHPFFCICREKHCMYQCVT